MSANVTIPLNSVTQDILLSGMSAIAAKTIIAPIERVKLLLQTQDTITRIKQSGQKYQGIIDCFRRIVREEGVLSLWRGNMMNVIRYAPNQASNFGFNGFYQKKICKFDEKTDHKKYMFAYFVSGGLAGSSSMAIFYPLDFVRTKLAVDVGKLSSEREFSGIRSCVKKIYNKEGLRGFYKGVSISMSVVFFYRGVYFGGTSLGKKHLPIIHDYLIAKFCFYHSLNIIAGLVLHPLDTVRRRLIIQQGRPHDQRDYFGIVDTFKKIYAREGAKGFMKGGLTNALRSMSSTFVMIFFDELSGVKKPEK